MLELDHFQDDEEFYAQEDRYLFTSEQLEKMNAAVFKEKNLLVGVVLIIIGIYALWHSVVLGYLSGLGLISPEIYEGIVYAGKLVPQLVVGVLIIWAGVALIIGKKKEIVSADKTKDPDKGEPEKVVKEEVMTDDEK
jgi:hypothetical protein